MMCTCGAPAIIVGYHAYKEYSSYIGNEVIMCQALAMRVNMLMGVTND